jgi:hypothetical protein
LQLLFGLRFAKPLFDAQPEATADTKSASKAKPKTRIFIVFIKNKFKIKVLFTQQLTP